MFPTHRTLCEFYTPNDAERVELSYTPGLKKSYICAFYSKTGVLKISVDFESEQEGRRYFQEARCIAYPHLRTS